MNELLTFGYKVETADLKRGEKALDDFSNANKDAAKSLNQTASASENTSQSIVGLKTQVIGLASAFAAIAAARSVIQIADQYTKFTAQLKLATKSQEDFATAYSNVVSAARGSQSDIGSLGILYARIAKSTEALNLGQKDLKNITETVALSLRVGGASATEAASAMLQLSQAFGSGVLRGEEFNAVNEAAPGLLKILAESIGAPIGQLKQLAGDGKLTSDILAAAFKDEEVLANLREQAKEVNTVSSAYQSLKNELTIAIGEFDKSTGASKGLADAIAGLGSIIANNKAEIIGLFTGLAAVGVAAGLGAVAANFFRIEAAIKAVAAASLLLAKNPIGLALFGIGAIASGVAYSNAKASELEANASGVQKLSEKTAQLSEVEARLAAVRNESGQKKAGVNSLYYSEQLEKQKRLISEIGELQKQYGEQNSGLSDKAKAKIEEFNNKAKQGKLDEYMRKYADATERANFEIEQAKKDLGDLFSPELEAKIRAKYEKPLAAANKELAKAGQEQKRIAELQKDQQEKLIKATNEAVKAREEQVSSEIQSATAIEQQVASVRKQIEVFGKSKEQVRENENANLDFAISVIEMRKAMAEMSGGNDDYIRALESQVQKLRDLKDAQNQLYELERVKDFQDKQKQIAKAFEDDLIKAFEEAFLRGGSFADSFKRALEAQFSKLVFRPIIEAVVTGKAPTSSVFGQAGGGSLGRFGGIPGLTSFAASKTQQEFLLSATYKTAEAFGASAEAAAAFSNQLNGAFKSVGGVGGAINIATSAISAFDNIKQGGYLQGLYKATGQIGGGIVYGPLGAAIGGAIGNAVGKFYDKLLGFGRGGGPKIEGGVNVGFTGGGQLNSTAAELAKGLNDQYKSITEALGGFAKNLQTYLFIGKDPAGSANTQLAFGARLNGQTVYDRFAAGRGYENVGRSDEELKKEVEQVTLRTLIAALQKTEFSANINAVLRSLSAVSASFEDLNLALQTATALKQLNDIFGKTTGALGTLNGASIEVINNLFALSGGFENLKTQYQAFYAAFYTEEEKRAKLNAEISQEFASLGYALPTTRKQLVALVDGLNLQDLAQQQIYATIMRLTPALDELLPKFEEFTGQVTDTTKTLSDAIAELADRAENARSTLLDAYKREKSAITDVAQSFAALFTKIADFRQNIGATIKEAAIGTYAAAKARFAAASGENVISAGNELAQAALSYSTSKADYIRQLAAIDRKAAAEQKNAQLGKTNAERQLLALDNQVSRLVEINENTISVRQAIQELQSILLQQAQLNRQLAIQQAQASLPQGARIVRTQDIIPGFASGGTFSGGMRVVGENGPELEFTGPSNIVSNGQSRNMLAEANKEVVNELQAMRREVAQLKEENRQLLTAVAKTGYQLYDKIDRMDDGGRLRVAIDQLDGETVKTEVV